MTVRWTGGGRGEVTARAAREAEAGLRRVEGAGWLRSAESQEGDTE